MAANSLSSGLRPFSSSAPVARRRSRSCLRRPRRPPSRLQCPCPTRSRRRLLRLRLHNRSHNPLLLKRQWRSRQSGTAARKRSLLPLLRRACRQPILLPLTPRTTTRLQWLIRQKSTPDPAIAADVSNAQLAHQKQSTAQLLDETEKTISGLKGLSHDQEEMVTQIRSIVNQSRKATSDGDFERAYNLATKAHLLSDALVKK